jgi:hypothetical protein
VSLHRQQQLLLGRPHAGPGQVGGDCPLSTVHSPDSTCPPRGGRRGTRAGWRACGAAGPYRRAGPRPLPSPGGRGGRGGRGPSARSADSSSSSAAPGSAWRCTTLATGSRSAGTEATRLRSCAPRRPGRPPTRTTGRTWTPCSRPRPQSLCSGGTPASRRPPGPRAGHGPSPATRGRGALGTRTTPRGPGWGAQGLTTSSRPPTSSSTRCPSTRCSTPGPSSSTGRSTRRRPSR